MRSEIESLGCFGVVVADQASVEVSSGAATLLGVPEGVLSWQQAFYGGESAQVGVLRRLFERCVEGGGSFTCRLDVQVEGRWRPLQVRGRRDHGPCTLLLLDLSDRIQDLRRIDELTEKLRTVEHTAGIGHWNFTVATGEVWWSEQVFAIHGYDGSTVVPDYDLVMASFHPDDVVQLQDRVQRAITEGEPYDLELRVVRPDGEVRWVRARGHVRRGPGGQVESVFGLLQDIHAERAHLKRLELLSDVVQQTHEPVVVCDAAGRITWTNPAFSDLTGFSAQEALGQTPGRLLQGPGTDPAVRELMSRCVAAGEGFAVEVLNYCKDGTPFWIALSVHERRDEHGGLLGFTAIQMDITARKSAEDELVQRRRELEDAVFRLERQNAEQQRLLEENKRARAALQRQMAAQEALEAELRHRAHYDALTGLANRRHFFGLLRTEVSRARRYGRSLAMVAVDIDHFKRVNDTYGHDVGDLALVHVARCMQGQIRDVDLLARTGGEEFVLLLPETGREAAQVAAERLRAAVQDAPLVHEGLTLPLTISLGVAIAGQRDAPEAVLKRADECLYAAKDAGRNTWVVETAAGERKSA